MDVVDDDEIEDDESAVATAKPAVRERVDKRTRMENFMVQCCCWCNEQRMMLVFHDEEPTEQSEVNFHFFTKSRTFHLTTSEMTW